MSEQEETGKYRVENQQPIQGQVVGDYATVIINNPPAQQAPTLLPAFPEHVWNVPFARNPFFTGCEEALELLHTQFQRTPVGIPRRPQAISGLGGIGKTQLAIEYAYRYGQEYQTVLWVKAETTETLNASYTEIARLLRLSQKDAKEQSVIVQAVKSWLGSTPNWLLILDNADELPIVQAFLPTWFEGHLLLTTRAQATGIVAQRLEVETMDQEVGALFLLRRAGLIASDASLEIASPCDIALARTITEELEGLPLALDQAGAYIEETRCSLTDYFQHYQKEHARILARRGGMELYHPEPVATTWAISFAKVETAHPAAAELLRISAFLSPGAIPEELLMEALKIPFSLSETPVRRRERGGWFSWFPSRCQKKPEPALPPAEEGQIDEAVAVLQAYSLVQRNTTEKTLSVHRLVQAVLHESMSIATQQRWMQRAVQAVYALFPAIEFANWPRCERLLPHAFTCAAWIEQASIATPEAIDLLKGQQSTWTSVGAIEKLNRCISRL